MRITALLFIACGLSLSTWAGEKSPRCPDTYQEKGDTSLGMHFASHDTTIPDDDSPVRIYHIVDARGKQRSGNVAQALLPFKHRRDNLTFQWLDKQKYLIVFDNRFKCFGVSAYARNAKGWYAELPAALEDDDARSEVMRRRLAKADPALSPEKLDEITSPNGEWVDTDSIRADRSGVDFVVNMNTGSSYMDFTYRFDVKKLRFVRLKEK